MGACSRNTYSDSAEIKPAQCCIKLVFHLTYRIPNYPYADYITCNLLSANFFFFFKRSHICINADICKLEFHPFQCLDKLQLCQVQKTSWLSETRKWPDFPTYDWCRQSVTVTANNGQDERRHSTWRKGERLAIPTERGTVGATAEQIQDGRWSKKSEAGNSEYVTHRVTLRCANTLL